LPGAVQAGSQARAATVALTGTMHVSRPSDYASSLRRHSAYTLAARIFASSPLRNNVPPCRCAHVRRAATLMRPRRCHRACTRGAVSSSRPQSPCRRRRRRRRCRRRRCRCCRTRVPAIGAPPHPRMRAPTASFAAALARDTRVTAPMCACGCTAPGRAPSSCARARTPSHKAPSPANSRIMCVRCVRVYVCTRVCVCEQAP
jgi:hypothetical protein